MNKEITEEKIEKEYNGGDQSIDVLDLEMRLYFKKIDKFNVKRENKYIILTDVKENKEFYLSGDNLITKKTMFMRIFSRKEYLNNKIENDNHIYSYILMPHIINRARCQINSKRASVKEYNDNPFVFFSSLKSLYDSDFKKENADPVEEWIIKNVGFWELFGYGKDGYKNYLDTFCLKAIEEIMESNHCSYEKFFVKKTIPKEWNQKEWNEYVDILSNLGNKRKMSMKERIKEINVSL